MDLVKEPKPFVFDEFFASGLEESVSPFLKKNSRKWGSALAIKSSLLSFALLVISFFLSYHNLSLSYILLSFVYFLMGIPSLIFAIEDLKKLEINIDILMTLSAFLALTIGSPFEGALLLVLFALAGAIEDRVSFKTRITIHNLQKYLPSSAFLIREDGSIVEKSIKDITVGMKLLVKAGETIPVDGEVLEGISSINLAHLTGEATPISVEVGSKLPGGALNIEGSLTILTTKEGSESTLLQIIKLITSAEERKPKVEKFLYHFGKIYSASVLLLTLLFALLLPQFFALPFFGSEGAVYRAISFMIAASPCALILAIPSAYLSALSSAARKGILLKGGSILEALFSCKTVAFDKTGTLTTGKLVCTSITSLESSPFSEETILQLAASLEKGSTHPIALAILKSAEEKKLPFLPVESFLSIPGKGVEGEILFQGKHFHASIGKASFIEEKLNPEQKELFQKFLSDPTKKGTLSLFLLNDALFIFLFQDSVRKHAKKLIEELTTLHQMQPIMLTGDSQENANVVANELKIATIYAALRPEDKLSKVAYFSRKNGLAMVGDGINDAPALARATVGVALGKISSATAISAADIILLNDEIYHLSWLMDKAKQTRRIVRENLTLALSVIFLASFPALLGFIPLWLAVILHEGGTILVGLNSLRLIKK